jgi:thioredoxin 1
MSAVVHVTDAEFQREVLEAPGLTIVDFWAEWCVPCKRLAPALEELAQELDGQVRVAKVDVDGNLNTPGSYGVSSIPTLLVFRDGKVLDSMVGFVSKDQLLAKLAPHLQKAAK